MLVNQLVGWGVGGFVVWLSLLDCFCQKSFRRNFVRSEFLSGPLRFCLGYPGVSW